MSMSRAQELAIRQRIRDAARQHVGLLSPTPTRAPRDVEQAWSDEQVRDALRHADEVEAQRLRASGLEPEPPATITSEQALAIARQIKAAHGVTWFDAFTTPYEVEVEAALVAAGHEPTISNVGRVGLFALAEGHA